MTDVRNHTRRNQLPLSDSLRINSYRHHLNQIRPIPLREQTLRRHVTANHQSVSKENRRNYRQVEQRQRSRANPRESVDSSKPISNKKKRLLKIFINVSLGLACLYQAVTCIYEFHYGKPAKSVELKMLKEFPLAQLAFCPIQVNGINPVTDDLRRQYKQEFGLSNEEAKTLVFSDFLKIRGMNATKMWELYELTADKVTYTSGCLPNKEDTNCVPDYDFFTDKTSSGTCIMKKPQRDYLIMSDSIIWMKVLIESPMKNRSSWSQMDFYTRVLAAIPPKTETILYHEMDAGASFPILGVSVIPIAIEFLNLDLPLYPCRSIEDVQQCQRKCIEKILYSRVSCRLPYMNNYSLPECSTPLSFNESFEIAKQVMRENLNCTNVCPRACHEKIITYYGDLFKWGTPRTQLDIRYIDKNVIVVQEYRWYTFNNLLADVGGSLGFFLGVSFLNLVHLLEFLHGSIFRKFSQFVWRESTVSFPTEVKHKNSQKKNEKSKNIGQDIGITGLDRIFAPKGSRWRKIFWFFVVSACTYLCLRDIRSEIYDFIEGNPDVKMLAQRNNFVKFPILTFCPYRPYERWVFFSDLKEQFIYEQNITNGSDIIPISELLKLEDNVLLDFWNKSGFQEDYLQNVDVGCQGFSRIDGDGSVISRKSTFVKTIFGQCFSVNLITPIRFRGTGVLNCILIGGTQESKTEQDFQLFIHNEEDDPRTLDPHITLLLTKASIGFFSISVRKKELFNRRSAPCGDRFEVGECRSKCLDRILESRTTCRLPFARNVNQKPCETPEQFNQSMEEALKFYNNYSEEWCDCPPKCTETMYQFASDGIPFPFGITIFILHIPTNLILVSSEYYQRTANALFANICGNLGLYLGFTALSMVDIFSCIYALISSRYRKSKKVQPQNLNTLTTQA